MSERVARSHTNLSNRAKARDNTDRKVVFRSVVDNPFRVKWPSIPMNVQNAVLACTVDLLSGVAEYNIAREQRSRRKRRRTKTTQEGNALQSHQDSGDTRPNEATSPVPPIIPFLKIGINEVTKQLERLASSHRVVITSDSQTAGQVAAETSQATSRSHLVLACRADVDPPNLIEHVPNLVAACNSCPAASAAQQHTWLVVLPKGAEQTLADALGLRRASMVLIEDAAPGFPKLEPLLRGIPVLTAPWLLPPSVKHTVSLVPTHIKQLRTTAPKDMKAAKEKRARERAAARERRKMRKVETVKKLTITPAM